MPIELILQEARGMSDDTLMEVVHFMQFIKITSVQKAENTDHTDPERKKWRTAGKYRGRGWMSDDFDAPLADFGEYM